jgi:ELWxxDGT repeat protein
MKTLLLLALSLAVLVPGAGAQTATLVEDIAPQESLHPFIQLGSLHPFGQSLFFVNSSQDNEAWTTDGTVFGTRVLPDACPDPCFSEKPEALGTLGGRLVYQRGQLWSTDGTPAGTVALTDPSIRITDEDGSVVLLGDRIYFRACSSSGCAVWSTDGTPAGTGPLPVLTPDLENKNISGLTAAGDRVYFVASDSFAEEPELWAADAAGTRRLVELPSDRYDIWTASGNLLFFTAFIDDASELWVSDGTPAGTRSLGSFAGELVAWLTTGPSGLYFIADDVTHGQEIWRSNGTPEGTLRITEIGYFAPFYFSFSGQGHEGWAHEIDGRLFFAADDSISGRRLWSSTGKPESTRAVGQAVLGSPLYRAGNRLFTLHYDESQDDCEAWSFDGQGTGTRLIESLPRVNCKSDSFSGYDINLQTVGNRVYFSTQDGDGPAFSIWRSDGTAKGTVRLVSIPSFVEEIAVTEGEGRVYIATSIGLWVWDAQNGQKKIVGRGVRNASSVPSDLTSHQGKLFFTAYDGKELPGSPDPEKTIWSSQGSSADTSLFVDPTDTGCAYPGRLVSAATSLVFLCDLFDKDELRSALPGGGGSVVLAINVPDNLVLLEHEGRVWFAVGNNQEIWTTDGTPAGTIRLTDAGGNPLQAMHSIGLFPAEPWALSDGHLVYFRAAQQGGLPQLWRSDGTPAGTIPLPAVPTRWPFEVAARVGSTTLVKLDDRLWRTDGTAAGTVPLTLPDGKPLLEYSHLLTSTSSAFYAYSGSGAGGTTLWRTDGTANGTIALVPAFEWTAYDVNFPIPRPVALGAKLFFAASDPEHGTELWITDGTPAGTSLLADIAPGRFSSAPTGLVAAGGAVWFTAFDPRHGRELWRTDGTTAGTRLVQDISPERRSSSPEHLTESGGRLFFSADDGVTGRELWSVPLAGPGACQPSDLALCLQGGRFRVESRWRDFQGNGGAGKAVPLTGDTGTFWFFSPSNVEVLLKVLDGRGLNDHFWVFYGALSSVEYSLTVTDTQTGLTRRYSNPEGQLASAGDTTGFGPRGAQSVVPDVFTAAPSPPAQVRGWSAPAATAPCAPGAQRLCLNGGRFAVQVSWKDFQGKTGQGKAVPFAGDTGFFWFFDQANIELAIKVLDGRPLNGKFWVFYGALSNVEYTITVTDTQTGAVKEYKNPSGQFGSAGDTGAF